MLYFYILRKQTSFSVGKRIGLRFLTFLSILVIFDHVKSKDKTCWHTKFTVVHTKKYKSAIVCDIN